MGRVIRPPAPALGRTLILPPRCILNARSALIGSNEPTGDGPDDTSPDETNTAEFRPVELGSGLVPAELSPAGSDTGCRV